MRAKHRSTHLLAWLVLVALAAVPAAAGEWSFRLASVQMDLYGQDQHVLTIHRSDFRLEPLVDTKEAITLDTDEGPAFRGEVQYSSSGKWGVGLDYFWFTTSQLAPPAEVAATTDGVLATFEIADRIYASSVPSQSLYYRLLADNDINAWTVDLYATRSLVESPHGRFETRVGLRVADFDNDYRAVVGITDIAGTRVDASSNYGLMLGPLVACSGTRVRGRSTLEAYLGQSVVLGSVELSQSTRDFTGGFSEIPDVFAVETLHLDQDVAIPITELRIDWTYALTTHFGLGLGVFASAWWDVPVPPGVAPVPSGNELLEENNLVFAGLSASVQLTF